LGSYDEISIAVSDTGASLVSTAALNCERARRFGTRDESGRLEWLKKCLLVRNGIFISTIRFDTKVGSRLLFRRAAAESADGMDIAMIHVQRVDEIRGIVAAFLKIRMGQKKKNDTNALVVVDECLHYCLGYRFQ
jgi:hypothetical protein